MRFCLLLFGWLTSFSFFIIPSYAQSPLPKAQVNGRVLDDKGQPLQAVVLRLQKASDSSLVKVSVSEANGQFEFLGIPPGKYFYAASLLGFKNLQSLPFEVSSPTTLLPEFRMEVQGQKLKDVTVSVFRPLVEVKADKMVLNVENSINATGSSAYELLQKSPGITIDNNDNISMKGKSGVRIYIDGKMSQLDGASLMAFLRGLSASDIESIEMISNPSAKYDASGNAGILNIKLKKNKKIGTNGSLSAGVTQGVTPKGNASLNLNYRDQKKNLFGNLSYNDGIWQNGQNFYRIQRDTVYDLKGLTQWQGRDWNFKVGADFFLNSKNTLGVMANGMLQNSTWSSVSNTNIAFAPTQDFNRSLFAQNVQPGSRTNLNANVNYKYSDTSGKELNMDLDWGIFRGKGNSFQPNQYRNAGGQLLYQVINRNNMPTDIDIYTVKADYEQPLWKGKLGFGGKSAYVETRNTFEFYQVMSGENVLALDKSNRFNYTEQVNALYANYNRSLNRKWSLQAGLRMENTRSIGDLIRADGKVQADNRVERNYTDLFPSAALTYTINPKHSLNLTYSRRIDRPTYQDLNPFENKLDELTYQKGNAFLRPQYTQNVELTHTFLGMMNTSINYAYVTDFSTVITDTLRNATYIQQRNLATQQIIGMSVGTPIPINSWWNGYVNLWGNIQRFDGSFQSGAINLKFETFGAYLQQTFNLGKNYTAEISGWFNGPNVWGGTFKTKPQGALDLGLMKQFWNKQASLKVTITDIFFTAPWRSTSEYAGTFINGRGDWESRTFRVFFSWNFGNNQVKASRERRTGLESEKNRIK